MSLRRLKRLVVQSGMILLAAAVILVIAQGIRVLELRIPEKGAAFQTEVMRQRAKQERSSVPFNATWTPLSSMSAEFVCAVVKAEDSSFFVHHGFDWSQLAKAARVRHGRGASTITQQLARNLYLSQQRSWWRKMQEAVITVWLELRLRKEQILALYLNSVEWGEGTWGSGAAVQRYFQVAPDQVRLEQALFAASLIANPRRDVRSQLGRIKTVYMRVNHRLLYSGYYQSDRCKRANEAWRSFEARMGSGDSLPHALSALEGGEAVQKLDISAALKTGCGIDKENQNKRDATIFPLSYPDPETCIAAPSSEIANR
jgi:monofunctional biosynthetic peptidoglycan transglycosylase